MSATAKGMGFALAGLRRLAGLDVLDRYGLRERVERTVHSSVRRGFGGIAAAQRRATAASRRFSGSGGGAAEAARQAPSNPKLFDLTPTDEQQMLSEAFREFATKQLRPAALKADEACEAPAELIEQAQGLGALMLGIPTALGGVVDERSTVTSVLAAEALAHGDLGLTAAVLAPAAVANALALWGSGAQQDRYLGAFVDEQPPAAALCVMEPRPLFDPMALQTTARRVDGGFALDGVKSFVPLVASAELFLVAASLEGVGPALFLVESSTDGLSVATEPTMGVRAAGTGHLVLEDVRVGPDALLADGDPEVWSEAIARSRLAWSALTVGTAQAVLDYVIPYVNERHAFGEPISHRQAVAFAVADIGVELEGLRLATYRAAARADQGKPFTREAAVARQLAATKGMQIGSHGVQLLGGHGYVKEHPVERWYRDLRAAGLAEGALLV